LDSVLRGALIYIVLLVIIRLSGRRTLAQMTPFDLVLVLIIAETTQQALLGDDFSITNAVVLIVTLIGMDILLSLTKLHSPLAEQVLDGVPTILVRHGRPDLRALRKARVDISEVLEAARDKQGLARLDQIGFAVLEPGGHITIVPEEKSS
jgi:uncharacterized membrane protein YcaP (DUF421 family)